MEYEIIIKPSAQRNLDDLPLRKVEKISVRISHLSGDPRPFGVQKLNNEEGYRIRIGNYRVFYEIDDSKKRI